MGWVLKLVFEVALSYFPFLCLSRDLIARLGGWSSGTVRPTPPVLESNRYKCEP